MVNAAKLKKHLISCVYAVIASGTGFLLRLVITHFAGEGLPTYVTFYPLVIFAAVLKGMECGILTTVICALIADYFLLPPYKTLALDRPVDIVGMALFLIMGVFISAVVGYYQRKHERQLELLRLAPIYNRPLIESSLDPLVTIAKEGKVTDVNEATIKATGLPREKLIGTDFSDYFTEPEKAREGYQQVFEKGFVSDYPLTIRRKDGKLMDVLYNTSLYKDTKGSVLGVFAAARDVTERKKVELELEKYRHHLEELVDERTRAIEESKAFIESTLNAINDIFYAFDLKGKFLSWNKTFSIVTGYNDAELSTKKPTDFFSGEDIKRISEAVERIFKEGSAKQEANFVLKDGRQIPYEFTGSLLKDNKGNIIGFSGTGRDLTERKKAEEEKNKILYDLGERVKELNCLYSLAAIIEKPGVTLEGIFKESVGILPAGWQYPEVACARI